MRRIVKVTEPEFADNYMPHDKNGRTILGIIMKDTMIELVIAETRVTHSPTVGLFQPVVLSKKDQYRPFTKHELIAAIQANDGKLLLVHKTAGRQTHTLVIDHDSETGFTVHSDSSSNWSVSPLYLLNHFTTLEDRPFGMRRDQ